MPYSGPDDPNLPDHVKEEDEETRREWVGVFEGVYADCREDDGDDCEGMAMRMANDAIKAADTENTEGKAMNFKTTAMIAFYLPADVALEVSALYPELNAQSLPPGDLHLTLCYLGEVTNIDNPELLRGQLRQWARHWKPIAGKIDGYGRFNARNSEGNVPIWLHFNSPYLPYMRHELYESLRWNYEFDTPSHGFTPHITLAYVEPDQPLALAAFDNIPLTFDTLTLKLGEDRFDFPLNPAGIAVKATDVTATKAGRRNASRDLKEIQAIHDKAAFLGAECKGMSEKKAGGAIEPGTLVFNGESSLETICWPVTTSSGSTANTTFDKSFVMGSDRITITITETVDTDTDNQFVEAGENDSEDTTPATKATAEQPDTNGRSEEPEVQAAPPAVNPLRAIKATDTELIVGNYLALFGGRDLEGEFFTKATIFESPYTESNTVVVDWEHGVQPEPDGPGADDALGRVDWSTAKADDKGLWVQRVLNRRSAYVRMLEDLIDAGVIGTSSEAIPEQVKKSKDGEILAWPLRRDSLTVSPVEPRMLTTNQIKALKSLAEHLPGIAKAYKAKGYDLTEKDEAGEGSPGPDKVKIARLKAKRQKLLLQESNDG